MHIHVCTNVASREMMSYSWTNEGTSSEHEVLEPDSSRVYRNEYVLVTVFSSSFSVFECRAGKFILILAERGKRGFEPLNYTSCDNVVLRFLLMFC